MRQGSGSRRAAETPSLTRVVYAVTLSALLVLIAVLSWLGHELYESVTDGVGIAVVDHPAQDAAIAGRSPVLTTVMLALTWVGGRAGVPLLAALAALVFVRLRGQWMPLVLIAATTGGALILTIVGKGYVGRVRPPLSLALPPYETSPSFPSGHTLNATALAVVVGYLVLLSVPRGWARAAVLTVVTVLAVGVGLSRVYLGQHWLTDVFGGWLVGTVWALCVITAHRMWLRSAE